VTTNLKEKSQTNYKTNGGLPRLLDVPTWLHLLQPQTVPSMPRALEWPVVFPLFGLFLSSQREEREREKKKKKKEINPDTFPAPPTADATICQGNSMDFIPPIYMYM